MISLSLNCHFRTGQWLKEVKLRIISFRHSDASVLGGENDDGPFSSDPEELERIKRHTGKLRDEKLQNDAFVLKKLNAALISFNDALGDIGSQNEVLCRTPSHSQGASNSFFCSARRSTIRANGSTAEQIRWHPIRIRGICPLDF
jgi:hypothetical protein